MRIANSLEKKETKKNLKFQKCQSLISLKLAICRPACLINILKMKFHGGNPSTWVLFNYFVSSLSSSVHLAFFLLFVWCWGWVVSHVTWLDCDINCTKWIRISIKFHHKTSLHRHHSRIPPSTNFFLPFYWSQNKLYRAEKKEREKRRNNWL